jgi:hypothetical protein
VDPITAFAMAQGALKAIRSGVEFYKECQAAAADVSEITMEVSGNIGKFLDAKGVVQEAAAQAKKESEDSDDPSKVNSQALNNVMMQMQLEQAEVELREMLIYQTPGLGDIWRQRLSDLIEEKRDRAEKEQKEARAAAMAKAARRRRKLQALLNDSSWVATILLAIVLYVGCMYLIVQDRIQQNPELGTCFIPKGSPTYDWYSTLRWVDCT